MSLLLALLGGGSPGSISASAAQTLADVSQSAAAAVTVAASASQTLDGVSQTATATNPEADASAADPGARWLYQKKPEEIAASAEARVVAEIKQTRAKAKRRNDDEDIIWLLVA